MSQSTAAQRGPFASAAANALSIGLLIGLSVATYAYERALLPLYGAAATRHHLNKVVWGAAIVGMFTPAPPLWPAFLSAGVLLSAMPQTAYWAAVYTGRMGDPIWGPVYTHLSVLAPVLYLGFSVVKMLQKENDMTGVMGAPMQAITLPVCRMAVMTLQDLWPLIPFLRDASDRDLLVYIGFSALLFWTASPFLPSLDATPATGTKVTVKARSSGSATLIRIALLPLLPYLLSHLPSPTLPKPLLEPFVHPNASLRILSSVASPFSGVVVVGEILPPTPAELQAGTAKEPHSIRFLRAGHSLLGGVWIGDRVYRLDGQGPLAFDASHQPLGDSIYSAFILQEAVRLVDAPTTSEQPKALFIGLGTGTAVSAMIKHGVSTSIVEVDPAVYDAATAYFGLVVSEPEKVSIMDARGWVVQRARELENNSESAEKEQFDYVVHDVFSGGGVPGHLFTKPFWERLSTLVKPDGVVAVNFAGKLLSESSKAIIVTLKSVFPQCRAFHDSMEGHSQEKLQTEFINWVFFCSKSANPLTFRPAVEEDFLESLVRQTVLSTISQREVDLDIVTKDMEASDIRRYTLTDEKNPLVDWQELEALGHWKLMRNVLPDVYWETY